MAEPTEPSTDQPEQNAPDFSDLMAKISGEFDKRFQGFQSLLDRRTAEFQAEVETLKTAGLTPEEQEQDKATKRDTELARLRRQNELLQARKQFPEEVDLLQDFFEKASLQEQLELLAQFRKAQTEAATPTEGAEEQPTPVDMNNPSRRPSASLADMAGKMTKELADKVLASSDEPGLLARIRNR